MVGQVLMEHMIKADKFLNGMMQIILVRQLFTLEAVKLTLMQRLLLVHGGLFGNPYLEMVMDST